MKRSLILFLYRFPFEVFRNRLNTAVKVSCLPVYILIPCHFRLQQEHIAGTSIALPIGIASGNY